MATRGALGCLLLTALLSLSNAGLVKEILRHRRQTLEPPEDHNATLPSADRPVVFNHVYNINVPASSLCSVDLDAPESTRLRPKDAAASPGELFTEHTIDGENQIVFTHRINVPRQACGCGEDLTGLKELMSRLEMLEGEVSALRVQCNGDGACCGAQVTGRCAVGTKPYCHGNGNYSAETCGCICEPGWRGPNCTEPECPGDCQNRGRCGRCVCHAGFTGEDCGELSCPSNCRNRGRCVDGQCVCDEGFSGEGCGQKACLNDCLARGYCVDGRCVCPEGYSGDDCSVHVCPGDCNNRGRCVSGRCTCESGYEGEGCAELSLSPPKDLTVGEVTSDTVDLSWDNEMLVTEYLVTYVPTSPGGLHMEFTVTGDKAAATVKELEPGIEYLINVYAVLSNKKSIPISARVATELPKPEGLIFKSVRETSVEVMWDQLDISFDGWEIYFRNTVSLPISFEGLGPGQEYEVSVNIIKNNTRASLKNTIAQTLTPPSLPPPEIEGPRQVEVKDVTDSSALVGWSQPVAPTDRLTMFYGSSSDPSEETRVEISPQDKQHSIDGLRPDTEYKVSLVSRRGKLDSDPSITTFTTALDAPVDLQPVSQTDDSITLEWTNTQADVGNYLVKYSPISGATHGEELVPRGPGDTTKATITGLKPGTEYGIGVTAVKNGRESTPATTNAATDIDPPRDLEETQSTENSLTLRWRKPQAKVGAYRLVYVSGDGQVGEVEIPPTATSYVVSNLTPGMGYTITLAAERGLKRSAPVTVSASTGGRGNHFTTTLSCQSFSISWNGTEGEFDGFILEIIDSDWQTEPKEYNVSRSGTSRDVTGLRPSTDYIAYFYGTYKGSRTSLSTPRGLSFSEVTDSTAVVHWSMPRSPVDNYRIAYVPFEGGRRSTSCWTLLPDMIPGKMYQVTVSAVKGLEESDPSTDTVVTALDKPQGLTAANVTDTSALLVWQPSVATVDGYVITYSADSGRVSGNTVEFEMDSLVPGAHYTVGVHALKEAQKSDSAVTEFTTDVDPPRDLMAINIQTDSATLTWKPPQAAVTGYTLTFSADGTIRVLVVFFYFVCSEKEAGDLSRCTTEILYSYIILIVGQLYRRPRDCAQTFLNGETSSGLYTVYVGGEERQPIQVYCDMTTDGGGWMVFLRRQNGKLEFFRNWKNYTAGFGNMNDEFWLGLSNLHKITNSGHYELRVDMRDSGESAYAQYDKLTIAEPKTRYKIYVGAYSGTAGDSMTYHQGRPFSTFDNDNDIAVTNCALSYKGAFWYKNCHRVNLMGKYGDGSHSKGINWFHWKGHEHSIEFAEMKIRPANFRNFESRKKRS
uniref:Tenascin Ca n=1 Tax=Cyclopterus lumpus TaxID=8103 RepID=A0A8C2ZL03_CYCLU